MSLTDTLILLILLVVLLMQIVIQRELRIVRIRLRILSALVEPQPVRVQQQPPVDRDLW